MYQVASYSLHSLHKGMKVSPGCLALNPSCPEGSSGPHSPSLSLTQYAIPEQILPS